MGHNSTKGPLCPLQSIMHTFVVSDLTYGDKNRLILPSDDDNYLEHLLNDDFKLQTFYYIPFVCFFCFVILICCGLHSLEGKISV